MTLNELFARFDKLASVSSFPLLVSVSKRDSLAV